MSKKHFKLTNSDLFESPGKLMIFIAVFVTVILCAVILIQYDLNSKKASPDVVELESSKTDLIQDYVDQIKIILNEFLTKKNGQEFKTQQSYSVLISQVVVRVMNLTVPVDYKDFHLELVVLLDKEKQNITEDGSMGKELETGWNEFLNSHGWLID